MYAPHMDATYVPASCRCGKIHSSDGREMDDFSWSASRDAKGVLHVSLANPRLEKDVTVELSFDKMKVKSVSGELLRADRIDAYNDFGKAPEVTPVQFKDAKSVSKELPGSSKKKNCVTLTLPAASVVTLEIK